MNIQNKTSITRNPGHNLEGQQAVDRYKMLLDAIDEGYCIIKMLYDEDGNANNWLYLEVNRAFELNNGLSDALGKTILETTPNIEPKWFEQYDSVARTGIPKRFREDSIAFNRVFNLYVFRVGKPEDRTVTVIFTDITEQAKAEEKLKVSEEKQAFLLKLSDSIRFIADPVKIQFCAATILGKYLSADRAGYAETLAEQGKVAVTTHYINNVNSIEGTYYYKDYGAAVLERMKAGTTVMRHDIANDPGLSEAEKNAYTALNANATLNVPLLKEGELIATMFIHFKDAHNWTEHEIALVEETAERTWAAVERARITESLKESEIRYREQLQTEVDERTAELKKNRDLLQVTLDHSSEQNNELNIAQRLGNIGNFYFDLIKDTVSWSEQLYTIMGLPLHTPLNFEKAISVYTDPGRNELAEKAMESLKTGIGFEMETKFIPFGSADERYITIRTEVNKDGQGNNIGIKGVVQDVTEIKKADLEIKELNTALILKNRELEAINSELTTFNNIAANDYNETFRALYLNLENLIKSDAALLSNTGKANLRKAQSAIQKMKMLTEDIVSFSKLPELGSTKEEVNLNDVLNNILEDFRDKISFNNAEVSAGILPAIEGHPLLLSLLLHHLLDNAIKFRKDDVHPVLAVRYALVYKSVVANTQALPYHEITFTDNGIGFSTDEANNIFTIFYRLHERGKYKGSGIGLAVCHKIMSLHGGFITAQGKPGKGCAITCLFPA